MFLKTNLESPTEVKSPDSSEKMGETEYRRLLFKKMLGILAVCLMILVVAELGARLYSSTAKPLVSHSYNFDQKYSLALSSGRKFRHTPVAVVIGDSLVDRDIYPEKVSQTLSSKGIDIAVLNLGVRGGYLEQSLFLLKQSIASGLKPQVVVIGLNKRSLRQLNQQDLKYEIPVRQSYLGRCFIYPPTSVLGTLDCRLAQASHLYRHRTNLKDILIDLPDLITQADALNLKRKSISMSHHGWSPLYDAMNLEEQLSVQAQSREANTTEVRKYSDEALRKVIAYCHSGKIPVILVWLPRHPLFADTLSPESAKRYQEMRNTIQHHARQWQIPYLNMEHSVTQTEYFYNLGHMNVTGAIFFSDALADQLSHPPYRPLLIPSRKVARSNRQVDP